MIPIFTDSRRLAKGPTIRRYFGIENDHFTGAVYCPGSPARRLTVALLDARGEIAGLALADQPCPRAGFAQDCGFRLPIPLSWVRNPDAYPRFSFRVMETGVEFPNGGREFTPPRGTGRQSAVPAIEAEKALSRLRAATLEIANAPRPWLLVTHETHRTGAPLIALALARGIARAHDSTPLTLCLGEQGALFDEFAALGPAVAGLAFPDGSGTPAHRRIHEELATLRRICHSRVLVNSLCSAPLASDLAAAGFEIISLIHEYPFVFSDRAVRELLDHSAELVFPCEDVRREFASRFGDPHVPAHVRPQGVVVTAPPEGAAHVWKVEAGIPPGARVVLACGTADLRKGFDWFCDFALGFLRHSARAATTHFVWLGKCSDDTLVFHAMLPLRLAGWESHVHLLGERADPALVLAAADIFLMCSRIDPFPNVVLEALALGVPVVGFDRGQGCAGILEECGFATVIPAGDQTAAREAIEFYLENEEHRADIRQRAPAWIQARFRVESYVSSIAGRLGFGAIEPPTAAADPATVTPGISRSAFSAWKGGLAGPLRGLRAAVASRLEPGSWPMPWGPLEFLRSFTVPPQLEEIILGETYRVASTRPIKRIVDGGCNIGISVLWFAGAYPEASIEAYEADPALAGLCRRNLDAAGLGERARIIPTALWTKDGEIGFHASGDDRGHIDPENDHRMIPCRDIVAAITGGVDLLKLDIEGAEIDCLEHLLATGAIRNARNIVAEMHLSQATAQRAYRILAGLAEAGFATAFEAGTHDWLGPDTHESPFPLVGRDRTFMLLRAWQTDDPPAP